MAFDIRRVDLGKLNSLTKYPSILTYHALSDKGVLQETVQVPFAGRVIGTDSVSIYATNVGTEAVFNLTFDLKPAEAQAELLPLENGVVVATLVVGAAPTEPSLTETAFAADNFTPTNFVVGIDTVSTSATGTDGSTVPLRALLDQWSNTWQVSVHQLSTGLTVVEQGAGVLGRVTADLGRQAWSTLGLDGSEAVLWESMRRVWSALSRSGRQVIQAVPCTLQRLRLRDAITPPAADPPPPDDGAAASDGFGPAAGLLPPEIHAGVAVACRRGVRGHAVAGVGNPVCRTTARTGESRDMRCQTRETFLDPVGDPTRRAMEQATTLKIGLATLIPPVVHAEINLLLLAPADKPP